LLQAFSNAEFDAKPTADGLEVGFDDGVPDAFQAKMDQLPYGVDACLVGDDVEVYLHKVRGGRLQTIRRVKVGLPAKGIEASEFTPGRPTARAETKLLFIFSKRGETKSANKGADRGER